jgi:tRNA (cytidine/uridine-2'-O-)-methyltransferase
VLHVVLWEPEIPPNTGNIARLCAATGSALHLIGRLGFRLDDRALRRAGLDYWSAVEVHRHVTWEDFEAAASPATCWCFSARGTRPYTGAAFGDGDCLVFGSESRGLPPGLLDRYAGQTLHIPMPGDRVRSLNLATTVGIALYEALRQIHRW